MVMNFIHKTLCFSGHHNVRCVCRIDKWNRNFFPILFKNFPDLNFNNWPNCCSPMNRCHDFGFKKKIWKLCVPCMEEKWSPNFRPRQVEFYVSTRLSHDLDFKLFHIAVWAEFCWAVFRKSKRFLASCFEVQTKSCTSSGGTLVNNFLSTDQLACPFSSSVKPNC